MMAVSSWATLVNTPQRMRSSVIRPKKRSTMLSQEAEVGVKCRLKRGCALSQRLMQVERGWCFAIDAPEEAQELAMPMARHAFADHRTIEHVERREQGGGTVALVVMRHGAGAALLHRQARLGAIERLDLALLVDGQHQRLVRRVEVETDDILHLLRECRVARQLEGPGQMWLQPMRLPD